MSVVRVVSGAVDVTSSGTAGAALRLAVPIGLAGLGGLWAERAGVVNIGLEGMLILGTWSGAYVGYFHGPWAGVLAGVAAGAAGGLLHAVATVSFGVDHVVSGVAVNLLGAGIARYLSSLAYGDGQVPGAGETQSPTTEALPTVSLPVLSSGPDLLGDLERTRLFLLADAAGLLRGLTADVSLLTLLAVLLVPLSFVVLWRTAFGLRLRAVGENPVAADSLGVPVYRMKYAAVVVSGALAGLGGAALVIGSIYREGQTAGRGFIGLAAVIFGNWRPGGLAAGAGLFGYADAVQLRAGSAVRGLLLLVALLLVAVAVRQALRRRFPVAGVALLLAGAFALWHAQAETVPSQLVGFTPHLVTLLVLAVASQRLRPPAADGQPYRRGQQP
ncbi:MAG: ABC transporter permease [Actinomycetota bacterium]|nr:ABC transporter permease [Actinomycetota bacterium]